MTSKTIEVPREPTDEMFRAFERAYAKDHSFHAAWIAACAAAPEAPRQEPVAWGAWRKSLNRFHYIECNVDYMQRTYGKDAEDMGIDFELVPLYRHPAPLSPDHSGGGAGVVLPSDKEIRELTTKAARQADLTSGANYYTAAEFAADAMLEKVKELNQ